MRRAIAALAIALATAMALPLAAAERVVFSMWTNPHSCHVRNAVDVAFADLVTHPEAFAGKCVAVRGHLGSRALFKSLTDFYSINGSPWRADEKHVRLGLYGDEQTMSALWRAARHDVRVIGRAGTCGDLHGDDVIMVMGYCHYTGGPVVFMSDFTPVTAGPRRLARAELPAAFSNLRDVGEDEPLHANTKAIAARWLDAVRGADANAFAALNDMSVEERDDPDSILRQLLFAKRDDYGLITQATAVPPFHVLEARKEDPEGPTVAFGCFCKTSNCTSQWPAHSQDARAHPAWPYACFRVEYADGEPPEVSTWR